MITIRIRRMRLWRQSDTSRAGARFLVVEGTDSERPLSKLSPFPVKQWVGGISSTIDKVRRTRSGAFLIEAPSKKVSDVIFRLDGAIIQDAPVRVYPHRALNSCTRVVRCRELEVMTEEEIREEMKDQGVT